MDDPAVSRVLALQRGAGNQAVGRLLRAAPPAAPGAPPRPPTEPRSLAGALLSRTDQRTGTGELSERQLRAIEAEVHPTTASPTGSRAWDGATGSPDFMARRAELQTELLDAMGDYLDGVMPQIRRLADPAQTPTVPISDFAGAGRAAKRIVDDRFGSWASAAALTAPIRHQRAIFDFDPATNPGSPELIDRSDPLQFRTNVDDLSSWIAQTAPRASAAQRRHGFDPERGGRLGAENQWLESEVIPRFVGARRTDLDLYDRHGFADTTRRRISLVPRLPPGASTAPGSGGTPSPDVRRAQWSAWQLLTHEYIHTLEHPAFEESRGGNRVLFEGFCEHFALQALEQWIPIARADRDPALRGDVEGRDGSGNLWPGFRRQWIRDADPGEYRDYVRHTRRIRDHIGSGGENALRGAFFQGHVELIGLEPGGDSEVRTTRLDLRDQVQVPRGIPDRAALAVASGVPEAEIARHNPTLSSSSSPVTFGMHVHLPECREHQIVEASPTWDVPAGSPTIETPAQIALQHGVTEADIRRANPAVSWAALNAGDHILVPRH